MCGLGRDPQGWRASSISAGATQDPAAGLAPTVSPPLRSLCAQPAPCLPFAPAASAPAPSAPARAPRRPTPRDVDPVPRPPFSFSRTSRGLGYLRFLGARRLREQFIQLFHSPKGPRRADPPALPRIELQILTPGIPALGRTSRRSSDPDPFSIPGAKKGCSLFPRPLPSSAPRTPISRVQAPAARGLGSPGLVLSAKLPTSENAPSAAIHPRRQDPRLPRALKRAAPGTAVPGSGEAATTVGFSMFSLYGRVCVCVLGSRPKFIF